MIDKFKKLIMKFLQNIFQILKQFCNKKIEFIREKIHSYLDKHIFSKIRILRQNRLIKLLTICLIILVIGGGLYLYTPKISNHFKADNNSLSFVEYNTNKSTKETTSSNTTNTVQESTTNASQVSQVNYQNDSSYAWPTQSNYYITNYFRSSHDGIDIAGCGYKSNIYSITSGEVVTASYTPVNGNYIVVKHDDGRYSMYAHLAVMYAYVGQRVEKGTVIAGMGATGNATGVHLHFSIWTGYPYYGGQALNPLSYY